MRKIRKLGFGCPIMPHIDESRAKNRTQKEIENLRICAPLFAPHVSHVRAGVGSDARQKFWRKGTL